MQGEDDEIRREHRSQPAHAFRRRQSIFRHGLTILVRTPGHIPPLGVTVLDPFAKLPPTSA